MENGNLKFEDVFVKPFSIKSAGRVFDKNHHFVMDIFIDPNDPESLYGAELTVCKLNGEIDEKPIGGKFILDSNCPTKVFFEGEAGYKEPVLMVRGWGRLTGQGGLNLDSNIADSLQKSFVTWIINTLNA